MIVIQKTAAILGVMTLVTGAPMAGFGAATDAVKRLPSMGNPFTLMSAQLKTLQDASIVSADKTSKRGVISADKKTLTFRQKSVRLVFHTGPDNDMLSYRINGLRNPTIVVPHGAKMKVLFINNDGDMFHNVRFGVKPTSLSDGLTLMKQSVGVAPLRHIDGSILHGAEMVIKTPAQPGKYAYFCTVRGHALGGMWGVIQVR